MAETVPSETTVNSLSDQLTISKSVQSRHKDRRMYLGTIQRLLRVSTFQQRQVRCWRAHKMPVSSLLTAALPETYSQQLGQKRRRLEQMFSEFDPPTLQVFESQRENYRMR